AARRISNDRHAHPGRETTLGQFQMKLRKLIKLDGRPVKPLGACTTITAEQARNHAAKEIKAYKARMRLEACGGSAGRERARVYHSRIEVKPEGSPQLTRRRVAAKAWLTS